MGNGNFEHVVVAIVNNIQASIFTTLVLKEIGGTRVWIKAQNMYHTEVHEKIGEDLVVHPKFNLGKRIAHNMASEKNIDFIDLSEDYCIVSEAKAGRGLELI
ncbi:NAD-binding protein [Alteribacter keqinensis]|uniref:NAD-binding protein n=1 Tax=Alteribacter keqinensis TaxID=2483800 RepID=UPI0024B5E3BB|nr:NAD-binding protein [Alteribacter keqinensis]